MDTAARVVLLLAGATLAMLCVKIAWQSRKRAPDRAWALSSYVAVLLIPLWWLLHFDRALSWVVVVLYLVGLGAGAVAARKAVTVQSEWGRRRAATERAAGATRVTERRTSEDALRVEDRRHQAGERADSRHMFDTDHPDVDTDDTRATQDSNRAHSQHLQDSDRATARADEDKTL